MGARSQGLELSDPGKAIGQTCSQPAMIYLVKREQIL